MPIEFACQCGQKYRLSDNLAGRTAVCQGCGQRISVPQLASAVHGSGAAEPLHEPELWNGPTEVEQPTPARADNLSAAMVDSGTLASNPGQARLDPVRYALCYPNSLIVGLGAVAIGGYVALAYLWVGLVVVVAGVWVFVQDLFEARARLISGDVSPAVVISTKPWRVAIFTDMRTGAEQSCPAIYIRNEALGRMTGGPAKFGMRLAAISTYQGRAGRIAWDNFMPTIAQCATTDQATIDRLMASIPASQWQALEHHLGGVADYEPGLYKLWLGPHNTHATGAKKLAVNVIGFGALGLVAAAMLIGATSKLTSRESMPSQPTTSTPEPWSPPTFQPPQRPATSPPSPSTPRAAPQRPQPFDPRTRPEFPDVTLPPPTQQPPTRQPPSPAATAPSQPATAYQPNQQVEIESSGRWYPGRIISIEGTRLHVSYDGWEEIWNETVEPDRVRAK